VNANQILVAKGRGVVLISFGTLKVALETERRESKAFRNWTQRSSGCLTYCFNAAVFGVRRPLLEGFPASQDAEFKG